MQNTVQPPEPQNQWTARFFAFWQTFRKNRTGLIGLGMLAFIIFLAIFAPVIAPYDSSSTTSAGLSDIYNPPRSATEKM